MAFPDNDDLKLYYSIGEVSSGLGISASLIRFWEKSFGLEIKKSSRGTRLFTKEDIGKLRHIHQLVKVKGMTLTGARAELHRNQSGEKPGREAIGLLENIRKELVAILNDRDQ